MKNKNQTAIVTGSSSGIGLDVAKAFYSRGGNIVLNGRDTKKLNSVAQSFNDTTRVAVVPGSIGIREIGERMVEVAVDQFGSVDVLVNNAGIFGLKPFLENTEEDLDLYINSNLKGTYMTTQAAVHQMKKQKSGSIVNIGTVLIEHSMKNLPASAALITKGGIHALTTALASELASDGIRVNAVAPGVVRTGIYGDADVDSFAGIALLNRVGEVKDTTQAVLYLAEAEFTTGVILNVDGGYVSGRP